MYPLAFVIIGILSSHVTAYAAADAVVGVETSTGITSAVSGAALNALIGSTIPASTINSSAELPIEPCGTNSIYAITDQAGNSSLWFCPLSEWVSLSAGEANSLQASFANGNVITGANPTKPLKVGDAESPICIFSDPASGPVIKPCIDSDTRSHVWSGYTYGWHDIAGDKDMFIVKPSALTKKDMYAFQPGYYPVKSVWIGAGNLYGDGTNCPERPTASTINGGPKIATFICADNDGSRLTGAVRMPGDWDGGTFTLTHAYIQTAANTGALHGAVAAQCRGAGEAVSSVWGTEVPIDDTAVTGSNANDLSTSAAVTPVGTCAAGDMLYFKYHLDANGTTTATATLHHLGFHMTYSSTSLSH
jgi:hypothetical protein